LTSVATGRSYAVCACDVCYWKSTWVLHT